MGHPFEDMYKVRDDDRRIFGDAWCFDGDQFPHGGRVLIARYEAEEDSDGVDVEIYGGAAPARFYTVVTSMSRYNGDTESMDKLGKCEIGTGSGYEMGELAHRMAIAISEGMISIRPCQG